MASGVVANPPLPRLGPRLTGELSLALVGGSPGREGWEPLQRQATPQLNRTLVQENQRALAASLLMYSLPSVACVTFLLLVTLVATLVIYVQGWVVMWRFSSKPCDQQLKWWLLAMLLLQLFAAFRVLCRRLAGEAADQHTKRLLDLASTVGTMLGVWMCLQCKTCATTNPELFQYAYIYLIYQAVLQVVVLCASVCTLSIIFWLHRNGLLESGPGPASAARAGLIDEIESVPFDPSQFSSGPDELQPPECAICQEEFLVDHMVNRTPCGHYFHKKCLGNWLDNYAKSCPLCRTDLEEALDLEGARPRQSSQGDSSSGSSSSSS